MLEDPFATPRVGTEPFTGNLGQRYTHWRWRTFAITWLAYAGFYLTRKSFSVVKVSIGPGTAIGLSKNTMTAIDTGYSIAYALGQFVCGVAGDRWGTRRVVLLGLFASVIAAAAMGLASTPLAFGVFFAIQGLCQATGWAPLSKNVAEFFSRQERGGVMGMWCTNYAVGGFVATIFASFVAGWLGWRWAFFLPALILLGIALLFAFLQRNRPQDVGLPGIEEYLEGNAAGEGEFPASPLSSHPSTHGSQESAGPPAAATLPQSSWDKLADVATNPMVLLLCFTYFLLKPARYLILFWGPSYVHETLSTDVSSSGFIASAFELGGPLGALLGGFLSDRVFRSRRIPVCVISLLALSALFYFMDDLPAERWAFAGALFFVGVFMYAADSLLAGTAAIDFGSKEGAGTASGLVNGAGSVGQILGPAIPALVPPSWGWHGIFALLALFVLVAACALIPQWNAVPRDD